MPDYRHKTRGFCLPEDAYVRRCAQGEFSRDEFEEVIEAPPAAPAAVARDEEVTKPTIPSAEKPMTEPDEDDDDSIFARKAPRRRR